MAMASTASPSATTPPVSAEGLRLWLNALGRFRGPKLLRMKGLINVDGEPVIVHAVQQVDLRAANLARLAVRAIAPRSSFLSRKGWSRAEIEPTLAALKIRPADDQVGDFSFGPESYGRFVAAIDKFGMRGRHR